MSAFTAGLLLWELETDDLRPRPHVMYLCSDITEMYVSFYPCCGIMPSFRNGRLCPAVRSVGHSGRLSLIASVEQVNSDFLSITS